MRKLFHFTTLTVIALSLFCFVARVEADAPLNIHLIAHSHDDMGWLKTVDEYFYGLRNDIQNAGVQYILDSVIRGLNRNPERRFIYVEVGFFYRWWKNTDDILKNMTYKLVKNGQLEFINGGWCMHDEANPYYEDMIGNMATGHEFLKNTFNVTPTIGWQIDPFGHSNTNPSFYAQMGFNGLWFGRIDYQDYNLRFNSQNLEMIWRPATSQGSENQIYTGVLYPSIYFWPYEEPFGNFQWDLSAWPPADPVIDNLDLEGYNVVNISKGFVGYFRKASNHYKTPNVMKTLGMDFNYQAAHIDFKNIDKVVNFVNSRPDLFPNVTIQYSTPSRYLKAVHESSPNISYSVKTDDFFPYADGSNAYWTGYFTSRVAIKGFVRQSGRFLQSVKRLVAQKFWARDSAFVSQNEQKVVTSLRELERSMGVLQHHDAVAGTEKQKVADDYVYMLARDKTLVHREVLNPIMNETAQNQIGVSGDFQLCDFNVSATSCNATASLVKNVTSVVGIYNPTNKGEKLIRVKVPTGNLSVIDASKMPITADVICANSNDATDCDLFFKAHLDGHSINFFYLVPSQTSIQVVGQPTIPSGSLYSRYQVGSNQFLSIFSDFTTFEYEDNGIISPFSLQFNYYPSFCDPSGKDQCSGAYIFRPASSNLDKSSPYSSPQSSTIYQGKVLTQLTTQYDRTIANLRFSNSPTGDIEVESFVDSIDVSDHVGKEVILLIKTSIKNNKTFYTDSNGMEMQKRVLNYRPTWNLTTVQPAAGNYYPVNSAIYIQDVVSSARVTLLTDRTHGGTSLRPGEVEIMLHRRLVCDDRRGVDDPLNETDPKTGRGLAQWFKHNLIFSRNGSDSAQRSVQYANDQPLVIAIAALSSQNLSHVKSPRPSYKDNFTLPQNVKILVKSTSKNSFVVWFHNLNDNASARVDASYFANALGTNYYTLSELSLSANQLKSEVVAKRLQWNTQDKVKTDMSLNTDYLKTGEINLRPLEIRTFQVDVAW